MKACYKHRMSGISLMEVLISIGVIALGIFGVATLIPVAQFKVAEGTSNDRQAAFGPSAVAQFRIHNMGADHNWFAPNSNYMFDGGKIRRRGYCLDPLGLIENNYAENVTRFPANILSGSSPGMAIFMPRIGLKSLKFGVDNLLGTPDDPSSVTELALSRNLFFLQDELVFDRPSAQEQQPNRQFFVHNTKPISSYSSSSLSWFATLSPAVLSPVGEVLESDEFLLSIVVVKQRVPTLAAFDENFAKADCQFAGEIMLINRQPVTEQQMKLSDLRTGDWLLLTKPVTPSLANDPAKCVYRWTQIIGTTDEEDAAANTARAFTISNDDFFRPNARGGFAIFMRGVKAVYERTIRVGNTSPWNNAGYVSANSNEF